MFVVCAAFNGHESVIVAYKWECSGRCGFYATICAFSASVCGGNVVLLLASVMHSCVFSLFYGRKQSFLSKLHPTSTYLTILLKILRGLCPPCPPKIYACAYEYQSDIST